MADDRTLVLANEADVAWSGLGGAAVIAATVPGSDAARWAWSSDGLLWVVGGSLAAEDYALGVLATQVDALDPWDLQGMMGDLYLYAPAIPGYTYLDLQRVEALAAMPQMLLGDCYERYYVGYVGWRPGELRAEIDKGLWSVVDADLEVVFRKDTEGLWEELLQQSRRIRAGTPAAPLALRAPPAFW